MSEPTHQLWTVSFTTYFVVLAKDRQEAIAEARDVVRECDHDDEHAEPLVALLGDWDLYMIPFGHSDPDDPDRTLGQWIERGAAPAYTRLVKELQSVAKRAGIKSGDDP